MTEYPPKKKPAVDKAEEIRLRYLYRRLAMSAERRKGSGQGLSINALKSLIGPDCAYHLYGRSGRKPSSF